MTGAPVGRLMRFEVGTGVSAWQPVGDPLPPFAHAPPDPNLPVAPWVVPRDPSPRSGDVIAIGEVAHLLLARCERDDPIYEELAHQTLLFHTAEDVHAWLGTIEVWIGRRLQPGEPWPHPPPGRVGGA